MKFRQTLSLLLTICISITFMSSFALTANAAHSIASIADGDGIASEEPMGDDEAVTFIVEVEGDPLIVQSGLTAISETEKTEELLARQQSVMERINSDVNTEARKGFVYTSVFNGFSIEGTIDQMDEIRALDGVKNVYVSSEISIVEPVDDEEATLMMDFAGDISNVDDAHNLGYDGEGTVIAIIDAGCDTSHEFFRTAPENPRYSQADIDNLVKTVPLNADAESGNQVYKSAKIPYAYNYTGKSADTYIHSQSHGTHVAGIAAGKNGTAPDGSLFSGVAPEAQLLILSCAETSSGLSTDAILAALNDAVLLKADVINLSFGIDYYDVLCMDIHQKIIDNCREAGISVVAANGNSGRGYEGAALTADKPDYGVNGVPCGEPSATAVAVVNNTYQWYEYISLVAPDGIEYKAELSIENNSLEGAYSNLEDGSYLEYVDCGMGYPENFKDVSGKLALIKRGDITFIEKASNAKAAGAVGILMYNYNDETINMVELDMPAAELTLTEGTRLLEREDKRLSYNGKKVWQKPNDDAALVADYSSWGIGSTLELKPEISAPGRKVYSSVPDNKYEYKGGTSMASPYMAGIAALSRQYYKTNPFADEFNGKTGKELTDLIENLAMNSASIIRRENGVAFSPRVQGAGLVDMEGILSSRVMLIGDSGKAKLSLGDDLTDTLTLKFDITNISKEDILFDKISIEVLTDGYEQSENKYLISDSVAIEAEYVTEPVEVLSGETVAFQAEVKLDTDFLADNKKIFTNGFYIDGYVILENEADSGLRASLPFTGFYDDWGLAPIFDSTIYDDGGSYLASSSSDTETGTYLKAKYGNQSVTLGRNPYFPEIIDTKYIAYSANLNASLNLHMTNLRAMENPVTSITDSEGTVVFQKETEATLAKFVPFTCEFGTDKIGGIEEGQYEISLKAKVLGDTERTDELCIPFTLDNTYPEILSAVYDEVEKTITVKAKENHYFSAFYVAYPGESEQQYKYIQVDEEDYDEDRCVTKVIDASMIEDISEAEIGCIDYARNKTYYDMEYFLDKVGAEITNIEQLKSMTQAEFNIKNNTSDELNADFVLAFYDESDRIAAISLQNCKIEAGSEEELIYAFFKNTQDAAYVKLFVWDFNQLKPVDALKSFTLSD